MSSYRIPNLRRDLPISIALLMIAIAAVVPGTIAVMMALAGFAGLMLLRLAMGHIRVPRPSAPVRSGNAGRERTCNRRESHAASIA